MATEVKDLVEAKANSATVAYQKFVLLTSTGPDNLFCFFENKDAPYYHLRIKSNSKNEFHYISCGNKSAVKNAFKLINGYKEYNKYKKAYFIDRDFDESIKNKFNEIYETPCYSIENLYCSINTIEELIKTEFQISADMADFKKILKLYQNLQNDFLEASLLFNAWYKLQKEKNSPEKGLANVSLTDSLIPTWLTLTLSQITSNYNFQSILDKYPQAHAVSEKELQEKIHEMRKCDLRLELRGKYVFNFMTAFIRLLIIDGGDPSKQTVLTKKVKYNMDNSMALTLLSSYAETPQCLISFIQSYN
jgi:hypothetical protein